MVSALDSGLRGLGSRPSQVNVLCSWVILQNLSLPTFTREHSNSNNCFKCVYTVTTVVNSPFCFPGSPVYKSLGLLHTVVQCDQMMSPYAYCG